MVAAGLGAEATAAAGTVAVGTAVAARAVAARVAVSMVVVGWDADHPSYDPCARWRSERGGRSRRAGGIRGMARGERRTE